MKKTVITICTLLALCGCKKDKSEPNKENTFVKEQISDNIIKNKITDSLFIGEPLITQPKFIYDIGNGGKNYKYFYQFEAILSTKNSIYCKWIPLETNRTIKVNDAISLELKRLSYPKDIKITAYPKEKKEGQNMLDIQIMLYTKIKEVKQDSILFYKYKWSSLFDDNSEGDREEVLTHIDNEYNIWYLETYTAQSEGALTVSVYEKYKINEKTGKIELITDTAGMLKPVRDYEESLIRYE